MIKTRVVESQWEFDITELMFGGKISYPQQTNSSMAS